MSKHLLKFLINGSSTLKKFEPVIHAIFFIVQLPSIPVDYTFVIPETTLHVYFRRTLQLCHKLLNCFLRYSPYIPLHNMQIL